MGGHVADHAHVRHAAKESSAPIDLASRAHGDPTNFSGAAALPKADLALGLQRHIHEVIEGRSFFDPYAADAVCMRLLLAIAAVQDYFRHERANDRAPLLTRLRCALLDLDESDLCDPKIRRFFTDSIRYLETDEAAEPLERPGGENEPLSPTVRRIPTMLCKETLGYYKWLAKTFQHPGDIVELGSWMGSSTGCLAEGLTQNPDWKGRRIHVYDSFIWRDWMKAYTDDPRLLAANLRAGDSFLEYFCAYIESFRPLIEVHQSVLKSGTEQFALPALQWGGEAISILVMDFAHDRASNEAMWRVFSPSFRSGSTIVVFNQFGNIPAGEVRAFCREKARELVPLHKPPGSAKAFRYQKGAA